MVIMVRCELDRNSRVIGSAPRFLIVHSRALLLVAITSLGGKIFSQLNVSLYTKDMIDEIKFEVKLPKRTHSRRQDQRWSLRAAQLATSHASFLATFRATGVLTRLRWHKTKLE